MIDVRPALSSHPCILHVLLNGKHIHVRKRPIDVGPVTAGDTNPLIEPRLVYHKIGRRPCHRCGPEASENLHRRSRSVRGNAPQ